MPKVGDKEFSYTDDGMRQAQIYADRTGQKVEYQENNRKFGYQEGGYTSDEYLFNTLNNNQENQRKRTFMQKHGSLPEGVEEPPSLLDESIEQKMLKTIRDPFGHPSYENNTISYEIPQWAKNFGEAGEMMKEGYDRYGSLEDTWPAFVKGIKEAWGYQEGGEVNFEPHMMYKKGKSEKADTYREHLNLKNKGWGH
jgi:hypothetical protein